MTNLVIKWKEFRIDVTRALEDCWRHPLTRAVGVNGYFSLVLLCTSSKFIVVVSAVGEPHTVLSLMTINKSRPRLIDGWIDSLQTGSWLLMEHSKFGTKRRRRGGKPRLVVGSSRLIYYAPLKARILFTG